MSREIKFRAYSKSRNRYLGKGDTLIYRNEVGLDGSRWWASLVERQDHADEDIIVEQGTGLKDKNGKEIYEGDIIQCGAMVGVATMFEDLACWCIGQNPIWKTMLTEKDANGYLVLPTTFIIGNIHENPELLGGGK